MRFELPGTRNRREILAAPEILRINGKGMSERAKFLFATLLTLLYVMFLVGTFHIISSKTEMTSFVVFALIFTAIYLPTMKQIINKKPKSLVFTQIGIADDGLFCVKYDKIGAYGWETVRGIMATGQRSKVEMKTLILREKEGFLSGVEFRDRFGNSIIGDYGYFFDNAQIQKVEGIFNGLSIDKIPDKT